MKWQRTQTHPWPGLAPLSPGVMAFLDTTIPMWTSERQIRRVREEYVRALLRQEIGYYDLNKAGEMAARMTEDSITMMDGMGTKLSMSVRLPSPSWAGWALALPRPGS